MSDGGGGEDRARSAITVLAALRGGLATLAARWRATAAALAAGAASALALRAGEASFGRLRPEHPLAAGGMWLIGGSLAALLAGAGLAAAVAAPGDREASGMALPRTALRRGVAVLSLFAVEEVILGALLLAAFAVAWRALDPLSDAPSSPVVAAARITAACAPPLLLVLLAVPAFRVAVAGTARGLPSWLALGHGIRVALARLPSLLLLLAAVAVATAPLWLLHFALGRGLDAWRSPAAIVAAVTLRGVLAMASAAWSYSAIARFVEGDAGWPASA